VAGNESHLPEGIGQVLTGLLAWLQELPTHEPTILIALASAALVLASVWATARRKETEPEEPQDTETRIQALIARNRYEDAGQIRLDQGEFDKARALFLNSGNLNKVALCYLSMKQHSEAAKVYREMGRHAEAAHYFQLAGEWKEAATSLHALGSLREAAELFERAGDLGKAAHLLRSLGDAESAARLFERAGLGAEAAAALLVACGREPAVLRRAGELFENAGDPRRAAECFAGAADWLHAAELFEGIREFALAAQVYERAEAWGRAGAAYERAGAYPEARTNYERAGDTLRAVHLAQKLGNSLDAGRGFYELGSYERAIETLQGVGPNSPQHRAATVLLGRIFLEKGLFERAKEKLRAITPEQPRSKQDLEVLLLLADVHEGANELLATSHLLERILEFDPNFEEVARRLERLQEQAWGGSSSTAAEYYTDRYEIGDEIGRGGMGIVHLAHDRELERPVAIKFLPSELAVQESAVKMIRQEARAAAAMNHPNIVHLYDAAVIGGRPCIVMEYVRGKTVRELMRIANKKQKRALPVRRVAEIARDTCYALEYAHSQNVVHRDVKPGNILIPEDGGAKLMDFGISEVVESGRQPDGGEQTKGTPQYMPPEQIRGQEIDGRTDLYALGISMFEMLTGLRPFRGKNIMDQQLRQPMPDPRELVDEIPEDLVAIVWKACEKQPDDRYPGAGEMADALNAFLDTPEA
jgi:tetratricopeptide (TPR) repeat protein